jgi:hypothetical protein
MLMINNKVSSKLTPLTNSGKLSNKGHITGTLTEATSTVDFDILDFEESDFDTSSLGVTGNLVENNRLIGVLDKK